MPHGIASLLGVWSFQDEVLPLEARRVAASSRLGHQMQAFTMLWQRTLHISSVLKFKFEQQKGSEVIRTAKYFLFR